MLKIEFLQKRHRSGLCLLVSSSGAVRSRFWAAGEGGGVFGAPRLTCRAADARILAHVPPAPHSLPLEQTRDVSHIIYGTVDAHLGRSFPHEVLEAHLDYSSSPFYDLACTGAPLPLNSLSSSFGLAFSAQRHISQQKQQARQAAAPSSSFFSRFSCCCCCSSACCWAAFGS